MVLTTSRASLFRQMVLSATRLVDWQGLKDLAPCAHLFLHFHNGQVIPHSICMGARGQAN
jgi:hypothetical protein